MQGNILLTWNGFTRGFVVSGGPGIIHDSNWKKWCYQFWTEFGSPGVSLDLAVTRTIQRYRGSAWDFNPFINPLDQNRLQAFGYAYLGGLP